VNDHNIFVGQIIGHAVKAVKRIIKCWDMFSWSKPMILRVIFDFTRILIVYAQTYPQKMWVTLIARIFNRTLQAPWNKEFKKIQEILKKN
jgi:hypothetical protein